ncbi:hypothetical protein HLH34_04265 [Gluconacetobacter azotocaptans]|uniref:Uncharacterized protein n=1 Tax=Gluconacetobacter azotocaptans TaxID=142834 RepID=A0A7W4PCZ0_9PROT|nr:hypothetical protein [Gluconacetobacter azotocaptans]MBB2189178.1 hypothetical protein [Gluconacetobacter azotocaptans]GBQ32159.1 hypothetical protein AA13594_2287 [Gluconacetobacter azotocaptans DSM 13594]
MAVASHSRSFHHRCVNRIDEETSGKATDATERADPAAGRSEISGYEKRASDRATANAGLANDAAGA